MGVTAPLLDLRTLSQAMRASLVRPTGVQLLELFSICFSGCASVEILLNPQLSPLK